MAQDLTHEFRKLTGQASVDTQLTLSEFGKQAQSIGKFLHTLDNLLDDLSQRVRAKNLFRNLNQEIERVIEEIRSTIEGINKLMATLDEMTPAQGQAHEIDKHQTEVRSSLKRRLQDHVQNFKDILDIRSKNLLNQSERTNALLLDRPGGGTEDTNWQSFNYENFMSASVDPESQQATYSSSRATATATAQQAISEISNMMQRMGELVSIQEESIIRIDHHLGLTSENLNQGHQQLVKYFRTISGDRAKFMKMFAMLMAFIFVFSHLLRTGS